MSGPLRIELLGGFRVVAGKRSAGLALTTRQQHLLAYLALHSPAPVARHQVAGHLWPESTDAQALTNLRRELHHLRHALPEIEPLLDAGSRTLSWSAARPPVLDVADFDRAVNQGLQGKRDALEEAAGLYRGDLVPDCADQWIRPERERLRRRFVESLTRLIELLVADRAFGPAIEQAQRLLRVDTLHEGTWRTLMRCHAKRGERAFALHVYQRCALVLKRELGVQPSAETRLIYRELLEHDDADAVAALPAARTITYPLIGRQPEWTTLLQTWHAALAGRGRLLLIRGEAGIGKTRLAEELIDWTVARGNRSATTRCYAGEGRLAYGPLAAWLQTDAVHASVRALDAVWLTEIARLTPDLLNERPDVPLPEPRPESWQRSRFFEALARVFRSAPPLLLVVDDLQWCDSDTLEWLHFFFRSTADLHCLVVGTVRSEEETDNAALGVLLRELERLDRLTVVGLGPLDAGAASRLAEEVAERPLDADVRAGIFRHTEGHPLFIVETGRMALTEGKALPVTPPRVQAVVAARLVQLSADAREVAELAAVVGRDFTFDVLAHVSDLEEDTIVRALDELWRRQIVRAHEGDRWDFSHDRIREVAYGNVGPARRRLLHRRIAQALEQLFASDLDSVSARIAAHLEQAGHYARAIHFFERAAHVAWRVSASEEVIRCLGRALALLDHVPAGLEREQRELELRSTLSGALTSGRGYAAPEAEDNLARVAALAATLNRGNVPVRWLWALWTMRFVLADLKTARELSEQALAFSKDDPVCTCEAHHALAGTLASLGELDAARQHFELAVAAYDPAQPQQSALGSDLGVFSHAWYSHVLWLLGHADLARTHAEEAIALARGRDDLYSQVIANAYASVTHQMRRDVPSVRACAETVIALCERHGFAYYGDWALVLLGWADCQEGRLPDGISRIETGIERLNAQRAQARRPYYLSLLAEGHVAAGRPDRAAAVLDTALATAAEHDDVWWNAELHRLKGELQPAAAAEASFHEAIEIARAQGSRALEQRAAASLALLGRQA
jgi:DNA-binding SARP family transcriptional activator/tetratricopeptide (TPR) repeat protein